MGCRAGPCALLSSPRSGAPFTGSPDLHPQEECEFSYEFVGTTHGALDRGRPRFQTLCSNLVDSASPSQLQNHQALWMEAVGEMRAGSQALSGPLDIRQPGTEG